MFITPYTMPFYFRNIISKYIYIWKKKKKKKMNKITWTFCLIACDFWAENFRSSAVLYEIDFKSVFFLLNAKPLLDIGYDPKWQGIYDSQFNDESRWMYFAGKPILWWFSVHERKIVSTKRTISSLFAVKCS